MSESGDLSNWAVPGKLYKGPGGAMELIHGVEKVVVAMTHQNNKGEPKVTRCNDLPLTGKSVVDTLITDKAVFRWIDNKMTLVEIAEGLTLDELKSMTPAEYTVSSDLSLF